MILQLHKRTSVLLAAMLALVSPAAADPLILQPGAEGKDASVSSSSPGTNYGSAQWFTGIGLNSSLAFATFDLSTLPVGTTILSAEIALWGEYRDGQLILGPADAAWDEMAVTWSNQPGVVAPPMDVSYPVSRGAPSGPCYWGCVMSFDITAIVQYWVANPSQNHGLRILGNTPGIGWLMASSDNTSESKPALTVQYDLATPDLPRTWGLIKARY